MGQGSGWAQTVDIGDPRDKKKVNLSPMFNNTDAIRSNIKWLCLPGLVSLSAKKGVVSSGG
jgi:hypothetical protein